MRIEIEIPDEYSKRYIFIFAGLEPVARLREGVWEIKNGSCSRCGECCRSIRESHPLGTENGCRYIEKSGNEYLCGLGIFRPYGCAIAEMEGIDNCTVRWKRIK